MSVSFSPCSFDLNLLMQSHPFAAACLSFLEHEEFYSIIVSVPSTFHMKLKVCAIERSPLSTLVNKGVESKELFFTERENKSATPMGNGSLKKIRKKEFFCCCCIWGVVWRQWQAHSFLPLLPQATLQWRWCVCTAWWWSLTFHLCGNSFLCGLFVTVVTCWLPNSPSVDSRQTYHYDWVIFHRSQSEWNCPSWQPSTLVTSYYFRCEYMKKKSR